MRHICILIQYFIDNQSNNFPFITLPQEKREASSTGKHRDATGGLHYLCSRKDKRLFAYRIYNLYHKIKN